MVAAENQQVVLSLRLSYPEIYVITEHGGVGATSDSKLAGPFILLGRIMSYGDLERSIRGGMIPKSGGRVAGRITCMG